MPAFLAENILFSVNIGIKNRIQIDMHEVFKVLFIAAGHRIDGFIRIGHCVEKGVERSLGKLDEGVLDRKIPGTAQNRVLDNVRYTGRILRRRAEGNIKDLVVVIFRKKRDARAGLFVPQKPAVRINIRQKLM